MISAFILFLSLHFIYEYLTARKSKPFVVHLMNERAISFHKEADFFRFFNFRADNWKKAYLASHQFWQVFCSAFRDLIIALISHSFDVRLVLNAKCSFWLYWFNMFIFSGAGTGRCTFRFSNSKAQMWRIEICMIEIIILSLLLMEISGKRL